MFAVIKLYQSITKQYTFLPVDTKDAERANPDRSDEGGNPADDVMEGTRGGADSLLFSGICKIKQSY